MLKILIIIALILIAIPFVNKAKEQFFEKLDDSKKEVEKIIDLKK